MNCPRCGYVKLRIEMVFLGKIACDFSDPDNAVLLDTAKMNSQWCDTSSCECLHCSWQGTVRAARQGEDFRSENGKPPRHEENEFLSAKELQEIRNRLLAGQAGQWDLRWKSQLEKLLSMAEQYCYAYSFSS